MRQNIIKKWDEFLKYEIREIVEIWKKIEKLGMNMSWENIGDPIEKWEKIPQWMKNIIQSEISNDKCFAYTHTKWDLNIRKFIVENYSNPKVCSAEDIIFFNGLWEAINKIFSNLPSNARVIVPSPTYPSHATAESMHHWWNYITYSLDPNNNWEPDLEELENKVKFNESIVWILVINPNNPTWAVFSEECLKKVVKIAKENDCFLIFDEIYQNIVFDKSKIVRLCDIIWDVPWISMKGISKELPWPGARCGWIEVYNIEKDANFAWYINTIVVSKMLEVCSTTLPQLVFPKIITSPEFKDFFQSRIDKYEKRANIAMDIFSKCKYLKLNKPWWVFYLTVVFDYKSDKVNKLESLNKEIRNYLNSIENDSLRLDKLFAYELMWSHGVCVVPLSGFSSPLDGFRMTLLEEDEKKFEEICNKIVMWVNKFFNN